MNFNQLRVFCEVAKAQSFTGAAVKLYLTQPAVSLQIKNLEEYYEIRLFERIGKRIILTEAGEVLFQLADEVFNQARQIEEAIKDLKGLDRGTVRVDSVFTFADYYLPVYVEAFHKRYPRISIRINTGNTRQIIENTLLHKNDIAFVAYSPETDKLVERKVISDRLVAIVSFENKFARRESISVEELNGQPLILREQGSSPRRIVDEILKTRGAIPQIIMESGSTMAIKRAVEAGIGIAIISREAVRKELEALVFKEVPFSDAEIYYHFFLVHHKDKYFSKPLRAFLDVIDQERREPA